MARKLATKEVAPMLGTTEQHVRKLARDGLLPHYRIGSLIRFDADEIEAFLAGAHTDGGAA